MGHREVKGNGMSRLKAPQRREQLLAVATKLFATRGFDATTTAAIAEAAGITEPVLYRHFENKNDLFIAVLRNCTTLLISRWKAAVVPHASSADQIRGIATSVYNALADISDAQRVIYGAAATSCDPDVRVVLKDHVDQFIHVAHKIVTEGIGRGEFRNDLDVPAMALSLVNLYTGFSFTRLHFTSELLDIRVGAELLVTGMCGKSSN